ncbi:hypothetical protein BK764_00225 [Bacillus thuringiensis serovar israelensis]|uniref:Uncharacterized protein n=3 Tax=Bacillus thuringiensis TaxID=1428 RepID=A0A242VXT9_BACTU|nr:MULTISPECIES: hypothetical protein [Bacillus cereus group]OTX51210.1 hypothetical protein BK724_04950 [Bacillus thuringiensis serovar sooncheon]MEB9670974.1 hypothetical protein [Bacillus anthracis]OTW44006.1 hypothetical protein BK699_33455 [Bacillus thuringiensis serovar mexicanensis]OTW54543.1 hypothetical protein BK699_03050 [Bacillus thuringiensis serovar mexicanensis]OTW55039.1 hypothetical protein BK699_02135 [Bacillus thuringiensis serovar mexicanensis]
MYKQDIRLSRRYLANPYQNQSFLERLKINNSIVLRDNKVIIDLGNGYSEIKPIDSNKRFKN